MKRLSFGIAAAVGAMASEFDIEQAIVDSAQTIIPTKPIVSYERELGVPA
jgi:hypothetical protein